MRDEKHEHRSDMMGTKYFCERCGYEWPGFVAEPPIYCPNCYKKEVQKRNVLLNAERAVTKEEKQFSKNAHKSWGRIRDNAYVFWMGNKGAMGDLFFVVLLIVFTGISFYLLFKWVS